MVVVVVVAVEGKMGRLDGGTEMPRQRSIPVEEKLVATDRADQAAALGR